MDQAALTGSLADALAEMMRRALSTGIAGWRDDALAFVAPWGFDLSGINVPVAIWQGAQDRMVPIAHGSWLATNLSPERVHLDKDEGHLSLFGQVPRILDELLELAG